MWDAWPAPPRLQPPTTELRADRVNVPLAVARPLAARASSATTPSAMAANRVLLPIVDSSGRLTGRRYAACPRPWVAVLLRPGIRMDSFRPCQPGAPLKTLWL